MTALLLAACGAGSGEVVGRWHREGEQAEFFDGGRLLIKRSGGSIAARWELVQPRRLLVTFDGALASRPPEDWSVEATADSLALCEADRPLRCLRYARAPADAALPFAVRDPVASPRLADEPVISLAGDGGRGPVPSEALAIEAMPVLKQLYTLQKSYQATNGVYARTLGELEQVGWQTPRLRSFGPPRIASAAEGRLCIDIVPRVAELWPQHVDEGGTVARGRCR